MRQRDIYLANLNPSKGGEQRGIRPIVIISGNAMNKNLGIFIICPLTTKIKKYAPCVLLKKNKLNKLQDNSEIITFQIRTIAKERLIKKIGEISQQELEEIWYKINEIARY